MPVFNAVLTNQAEDAALDYDNTQIALQITHVGFGTSTAVVDLDQLSVLGEVGRVAVAGGGIEPNSRTLTANVIWTPDQVRDIGQIGFYAGDTLFCIYAPGTAIVRVTPDVGIAASFSVSLVRLPNGSVNIVVDDSLSPIMLLLGQHQADPDPHGQYTMKAAFDSHVAQNALEHTNLLAMIQAVNQRVANLEIREEIQIGEFVITDDPRNPATYKGYGHFRLVPDVLLKGLSSGGVTGQYSQVGSGSGQQVRTTFFWQRFDPNLLPDWKIFTIGGSNLLDINLRDVYDQPLFDGDRIKFIVPSDTFICSSTTATYALVSGEWEAPVEIMVEVYGEVVGRGGNGGNMEYATDSQAIDGYDGGPAIFSSVPLEIINFGVIAGGGGGGASGRDAFYDGNHGGGGGGGGAPFGQGGIYVGSSFPTVNDYPHFMGTNATKSAAGTGAVMTGRSTSGGNGGGWGLNGADAQLTPSQGWTSGAREQKKGGLAGIAITGPVAVTGNPVLGR